MMLMMLMITIITTLTITSPHRMMIAMEQKWDISECAMQEHVLD